MQIRLELQRFTYGDRDTILYGLAVGFGRDPMRLEELPFVYEGAGLRAVPPMATIFGNIRQITILCAS